MTKKSKTRNKIRVYNWRKKLFESGGKLIQVPLKKEDVALLYSLKDSYGGISISELISEALRTLKDGPKEHKEVSVEKSTEASASSDLKERIRRDATWRIGKTD